MSSTKHKLRLIGAFAALAILALTVGCRGFFMNPTVSSISINPTNPTVPLNGTTQMHAFGTNSDGSPSGEITSKVTWESDSGAVSVNNNGLLTGVALSSTPANITASFQAATPQSTTATVCVEGGTNFQILPVNQIVTAGGVFPGGGYTASIHVSGSTLDITSSVQWSASGTGVTISSGIDPAPVDTTGVLTPPETVTVTGSYTCNGITTTQTTNLTVD